MTGSEHPEPAWRRVTEGEQGWQVAAVIATTIVLQLTLPDRLTVVNPWLLPGLEAALLVGLAVASPGRFSHEAPKLRAASLLLSGILGLANGWAALRLVLELVAGQNGDNAQGLLTTGDTIWLTNVVAFGLWYWQFDRGGPAARARAVRGVPDFVFTQMQSPELSHQDWEPRFPDYLYLSLTNSTAFSPTDVMPMTRWAKTTMAVQSLISFATAAVVIARAVNVLR